MDEPADLGNAHPRIARPTDNLAAVTKFYPDGLGFEILFEFKDHDRDTGSVWRPILADEKRSVNFSVRRWAR